MKKYKKGFGDLMIYPVLIIAAILVIGSFSSGVVITHEYDKYKKENKEINRDWSEGVAFKVKALDMKKIKIKPETWRNRFTIYNSDLTIKMNDEIKIDKKKRK